MRDRRPNVLIVVLDSARPELLSCFSGPPASTPNIDRLAGQSYLFETAISPSAWTFPVMASVFTGMLPTKHGGHDEHRMLDSHYPTMAEMFSKHGYDTAAFADVPYVGPTTRLDRGFSRLSNLRREQVSASSVVLKAVNRAYRAITREYQKLHETRVVIREALRWLERDHNPNQPFLLYVHSDETHAPLLPPARYRRKLAGLTGRQMRAINQDKQLFVGGSLRMTDADLRNLRRLAYAEAAFFDEWFGRLLARLERRGWLENTVVVVMADHGDNFGEHGLIRHGLCLYDTLLRVPLIIRPPGGCPPRRIRPPVQLIDLLPTLLTLAEIEDSAAAEFQGCDLLDTVRTGRFPDFVISELYRPTTGLFEQKVPEFMEEFRAKYDRVLRSIRTPTHKFLWSSNGRHELYDLQLDPGEEHNLVSRQPDLAHRLRAQLERWLGSFRHAGAAVNAAHPAPPEDAQLVERLRELGYV